MLVRGRTYQDVCDAFRWNVPGRFNIAEAACDRHVGSRREVVEDGIAREPEDLRRHVLGRRPTGTIATAAGREVRLLLGEDERGGDVGTGVGAARQLDHPGQHGVADRRVGEPVDAARPGALVLGALLGGQAHVTTIGTPAGRRAAAPGAAPWTILD